jgi:hypothetical protein
MTAHFPGLIQALQIKIAGLNLFYLPKEGDLPCICVLGLNFGIFLRFCYWILEMFWSCGIFVFHFICTSKFHVWLDTVLFSAFVFMLFDTLRLSSYSTVLHICLHIILFMLTVETETNIIINCFNESKRRLLNRMKSNVENRIV